MTFKFRNFHNAKQESLLWCQSSKYFLVLACTYMQNFNPLLTILYTIKLYLNLQFVYRLSTHTVGQKTLIRTKPKSSQRQRTKSQGHIQTRVQSRVTSTRDSPSSGTTLNTHALLEEETNISSSKTPVYRIKSEFDMIQYVFHLPAIAFSCRVLFTAL